LDFPDGLLLLLKQFLHLLALLHLLREFPQMTFVATDQGLVLMYFKGINTDLLFISLNGTFLLNQFSLVNEDQDGNNKKQ